MKERSPFFILPMVLGAGLFLNLVLQIHPAMAQEASNNIQNIIAGAKISGHLRLYNYTRRNDEGTPVDNNALAFGGDVTFKTGSFEGFSAAVGFYSANNIPIPEETVNKVLVGPNNYLEALPVAYLQFDRYHILARGGRQLINTPWARGDMFTMLPRAFNGIAATIHPLSWFREIAESGEAESYEVDHVEINPSTAQDSNSVPGPYAPHFSIFIARMFNYESRFNDHFTSGNRYTKEHTDGFVTTGLKYHQRFGSNSFHVQGWYYNFYDFAMLGYMEGNYRYDGDLPVSPLFGAQLVLEGNSGEQRLGPVDVQVYGLKAGIGFSHGSITLVGNWSPTHAGTFRQGGMVHPYSDLSGTFYTDTMNNGMGDIGPGYAYGIKLKFNFFKKAVDCYASYVRYLARYGYGGAAYTTDGPYGYPESKPVKNQKQWALDLGAAYHFKGALKGLEIHDHIGIRDAYDWPVAAFIDNRLAMVYAFSF